MAYFYGNSTTTIRFLFLRKERNVLFVNYPHSHQFQFYEKVADNFLMVNNR